MTHFVAAMAVTEDIAREQASIRTGYTPQTIGTLAFLIEGTNSSRQSTFVFETTQDVTKHPYYINATLSKLFDLGENLEDNGPVLQFGREITAGG